MPQGIECYRDGDFELGNDPFFDLSSGFILGSVNLGPPIVAGNLVNAQFANGNPWYIWLGGDFLGTVRTPIVSIVGTTISWTPNPKGGAGFGKLVYGIR